MIGRGRGEGTYRKEFVNHFSNTCNRHEFHFLVYIYYQRFQLVACAMFQNKSEIHYTVNHEYYFYEDCGVIVIYENPQSGPYLCFIGWSLIIFPQSGPYLYFHRVVLIYISIEWSLFMFLQSGTYLYFYRVVLIYVSIEWHLFIFPQSGPYLAAEICINE